MPSSWYMQSCDPTGTVGAPTWIPLLGLTCPGNEPIQVRGSYTWSKMFVRCISYIAPANAFNSLINAVHGNQTVTVNATGTFEDNVNSDALVTGDLIVWHDTDAAPNASIVINLIGSLLTAASDIPIIGAGSVTGGGNVVVANNSLPIEGELYPTGTENNTKYTFRSISTLSNLTVNCTQKTTNLDLYLRVNGVNGASHVHITATGRFEDAVNTDAVAVGQTVNAKAGAAGSVRLDMLHLKSASVGRQVAATAVTVGATVMWGAADNFPLEGNLRAGATNQGKARMNWSGKNLFVRVITNTGIGATTVRTRKGAANANLNVSIGAGATGVFEDLVNTDSFLAADLHQYQVSTPFGAGNVILTIIGFELQQPAAPGPGGGAWQSKAVPVLVGGR